MLKRQTDTEKEPGLFATPVVILSSDYEATAVLIIHGGNTKALSSGGNRQAQYSSSRYLISG